MCDDTANTIQDEACSYVGELSEHCKQSHSQAVDIRLDPNVIQWR
jgi:hypothetical protein